MSGLLVPLIIGGIAVYGLTKGVDVYSSMLSGIGEGFSVLLKIAPSMIALLSAFAMLRASGALDMLTELVAPLMERIGIPPETVPLMLIRPFSGSAALGVGSELISSYGADSIIGRTAAVMLGSTETTFYTIAVYFGAAKIKNTRYAVLAALLADIVGFLAAAAAVRLFF